MKVKKIVALTMAATLLIGTAQTNAWAYGETNTSSTLLKDTQAISDYQTWKTDTWTGKESVDSSKIILTPGKRETDLNFAWYSMNKGVPAVKVSKNADMSNARIFKGKATDINRSNIQNTYKASNKVSIDNYFEENTTYYYSYTDDNDETNVKWSEAEIYKTKDSSQFQAILVGDPQVGASGSSGQGTMDDINIAVDTYNWNKTLSQTKITAPNASFILSAGDQVDYSNVDSADTKGIRESEYAGFTYPSLLRSLPLATTIGNHESKGTDYRYHYNNPNSSDNLGETNSGSDYYFSYGNALIISLNSNNRNTLEHRELLRKAVESHVNAQWKVVIFHHDIYGSGQPHSDTDGANLRTLFAPLMDEFGIDVCLTGHDHSYARTYLLADGTAIDYGDSVAVNPEGTLYIAAGSASGSKFYNLATAKQYYIAERSNTQLPTFSTLDFSENSFVIRTYDYNGKKYADDYTLYKTDEKMPIKELINQAKKLKQSDYTTASWEKLQSAISSAEKLMQFTQKDEGAAKLAAAYDRHNDGNNQNDMLDYYAYAQGDYKDTLAGTTKLAVGFSALLDKTTITNLRITKKAYEVQYNNLMATFAGLEKVQGQNQTQPTKPVQNPSNVNTKTVKLTIKANGKAIKSGKTIKLKKGKSLQLKVKIDGVTGKKIQYTTSNKKIVKISASGKLKAIKKSKKKVKITVSFGKKKISFKVKTK